MSTARATEYMIPQEAVETAGCVTYWRVSGDVNIAAFTEAWTEAGLDEKLLRKAPGPETALRRAVLDQASRGALNETAEIRTLIRPCQEAHTWAVVQEIAAKDLPPVYSTIAIVWFENDQPNVRAIDGNGAEVAALHAEITDAYRKQQGVYATEDITGWLVDLARKNGSVTLRDSGGVYFIPRTVMDFWNKAANVLEAVTNKAHTVFRIPAMKNSEAVEAITAAVTAEALKVAEDMEAELLAEGDDKLGTRAVKSRQKDIEALIGKLSDYEKLLGLQLDVRDRVEKLQANLATAAMTEGAAA